MSKIKKIIIVSFALLSLVFIAQEVIHNYIEAEANKFLAPYGIRAELSRFDKLTLKSNFISHQPLVCKIKLEGRSLLLVPLNKSLLTIFLPNKIIIPL